MSKLSLESYKGVRDFYPEDKRIENYIFDTMKKVVRSFGYEEYDASVLEPADLYRAKTGEEIVNEQTYTFEDQGGREVTLRPEMTPTLARMVAAKKRELTLPIRWFSIPNLFRYESPQRGRLREHWQLNADLLGVSNTDAEVEIITIAYKILIAFGLREQDFEIRLNDRKLINLLLRDIAKLGDKEAQTLSKLIDKKDKMPQSEFESQLEKLTQKSERILEIINTNNIDDFEQKAPKGSEATQSIREIIQKLELSNIKNVFFTPALVRGFDYYSGTVFEIFDRNPQNRRSVFGGGRFDELLGIFGSDLLPAVGFGAGDVIIRDLLETYDLLPESSSNINLTICVKDKESAPYATMLANSLRGKNFSVSVDYTFRKLGDQVKAADRRKIPFVVCVGDNERNTNKFKLKRLSDGNENDCSLETLSEILKNNA